MTNFKNNLLKHFEKYPLMEIEDIFKLIYQGAFGCEHMIDSFDKVTKGIENEYYASKITDEYLIEDLSDKYCRVHLSCLSKGLCISTLGSIFFLSARTERDGNEALCKMLDTVTEMINEGLLTFSHESFVKKADEWKKNGYPPLHHSDKFRSLYNPHYRVIAKEFVPFLPLLTKIDLLMKEEKLTLAIDGGSGSGKTTLASLLNKIYECSIFHMDDFFLTPQMRTSERFMEVGGNVDRERFEKEVLIPLSQGKVVSYKPFDCSKGDFAQTVNVTPKRLVIIEGAYSLHPELFKYYDYTVFLDIDKHKQKNRILKRNSPTLAKRFFEEWIPLENIYFEKTDIKNRAHTVISI